MTLDEAITLCGEIIGEKYLDGHVKCASNHEQFKEWLEELKHITNPQPYKFEDLKKGMWMWDNAYKVFLKIIKIIEYGNVRTLKVGDSHCKWHIEFKENRFFPITKLWRINEMGYKLYEVYTSRGQLLLTEEAVEKEITRLIEYRVKKDILVPKKIKNGLMKPVKIKKGKLYKWDYLINNGYIFLAKEITSKDNIRSYKDVIKLKKDDLEKYFERCKV